MAHDSYCCDRFPLTRPFPIRRQGTDYVAKVVHQELVIAKDHTPPAICPEQCRPKEHPDWEYC